MYEMDDDYNDEGEEAEEISNEIWQEACWIVISAYFDEKGRTPAICSKPVAHPLVVESLLEAKLF